MSAPRHSWSQPVRFERKTERTCVRCGLIKVTRHEQIVWIEFWRPTDGVPERIETRITPPCQPAPATLKQMEHV